MKKSEKRILSLPKPNLPPSFERWNRHKLSVLFPDKKNGRCGCGCGRKLKGFRKRWATSDCEEFALYYLRIRQGKRDIIFHFIALQKGRACCKCGSVDQLELDHIVPICKGGGGQWLDNYQILCRDCHIQKTKEDVKDI